MSQKVEKSTIFLDFFEVGNNLKFDDPPLWPNWEKFEIRKILSFGNPPQKKNISLKHLKLPKNHFKPNFIFVQLKHLKPTFTFVKKWK